MITSAQNYRKATIVDSPSAESSAPGPFRSILFDGEPPTSEPIRPPDFFRDLNLDQIVANVTGRDEYHLKPLFYARPTKLATIAYRQGVMRDLEDDVLLEGIKVFAAQMRRIREHLGIASKVHYKPERQAWFLEAAASYFEATEALWRNLERAELRSQGFLALERFLREYTRSDGFEEIVAEANRLKIALGAIKYSLIIKSGSVTVRHCHDEIDYSAAVENTFAKFKQGAVKDYLVKFHDTTGLNHVEGQILDRVALLNPEVFRALDRFCAEHTDFLDPTLSDFDREIQFYVAYLEHVQMFKSAGLKFCYPDVSDHDKAVCDRDGFDMALAGHALMFHEGAKIVCNDFHLSGPERIFVVTGPNQGGKTTFARTFGQLHYLACLGCPVPGSEARLFLFDDLFVHFERAEDVTTLRGKLEDDLVRVHEILERATPNSVVIMNEIFSSTTLEDAVLLGRRIIERISDLDALCVCVTFLDELSALNEKTVSVVAGVVPQHPTDRTFKIERRPANGLAYSLAIAEKYRVTYRQLKERITS